MGIETKLGGVKKKQKVPLVFCQSFCPSDSVWSYIVVIVYPKGGAFDKKLRVLFGVFFTPHRPQF